LVSIQVSLKIAVAAAVAAGQKLKSDYATQVRVPPDDSRDVKIAADVMAEAAIIEVLRSDGRSILSEESGRLSGRDDVSEATWIIDPLDGTANYARGLPLCCVSIALWKGDEPLLGVVYDFLNERLYTGLVGVGAWCNDVPLAVSTVSQAACAVFLTGFPSSTDLSATSLQPVIRQIQQFKRIRLLGSAALSLAHVASGAADLYAEKDIHLWDVAGGIALVRAAGGTCESGPFDSSWRGNTRASNGRLDYASLVP